MGRPTTIPVALLAVLVVAGLAFLLLRALQPPQEARNSVQVEPAEQSPTPPPTTEPHNINDVLALIAEERKGRAVELFLELVDGRPEPSALRPIRLSEEDFVRLPATERDRLQEELLSTFGHARALAKEIDRRARDALAEGNRDRARKLLEGLKHLGAANVGPEVTKLAELVGEAMVRLAEDGLSAMKEGGVGSPTTQNSEGAYFLRRGAFARDPCVRAGWI